MICSIIDLRFSIPFDDEDEEVAVAAARGLGVLGETRATERLESALQSASQRGRVKVVAALQESLRSLHGR